MSEPLRKSRFRLSLRALMVLVLVVGGLIGWKANRARTQRRAVEMVQRGAGSVEYDYQLPGEKTADGNWLFPGKSEPQAPKWLRRWLGDEYFQEVTGVSFDHNPPPEVWPAVADLDHLISLDFNSPAERLQGLSGLRRLGRVRSVQVNCREVDEASLAEIASLPRLEELKCFYTDLTNAGLARLARSPRLESLTIIGAPNLNDSGVARLAKIRSLKVLILAPAERLTDRSLHDLAPILPNLESLEIGPSMITDEGMAELKAGTRLKRLHIGRSGTITDVGLVALRDLKDLEFLSLFKTKVTDAGLARLRGLKALKALELRGTQVTPEGAASLKESIPGLRVNTDQVPRMRPNPIPVPTPR